VDLDFSQEQEMLREMVRGLCAEHASLERVRALEDDPTGYPKEFFAKLAELGLLGLLVPEAYGGSDQSLLEAAVVYEELGRALAPTPHFVSSVLSALVLRRFADAGQRAQWLPAIASGEAILSAAWLEPKGGFGARGVQLEARRDGDAWLLSGRKWHVPYASSAERLLVLARTGEADERIDLFLVDPRARGVALVQQHTLGSECQYEVRLDAVRVAESDRIGEPGSGWRAWHETMLDGIILLAAQAIGGADRALEMAVDYARERKQFDKPIGAFQAIAHYLSDRATEVEGGRTLCYEAAWARANGKPVDRLAPMAKLFCCRVYRDTTATAEQVFGGVGFTLEYDIQLYFRRAKQLQLSWWDDRYLEEQVASAVLDTSGA
jgi:alkylation response protein AidB-like acyl-CoA dehydrogenase